jgi:hypothetical protein
MDHFQNIRYFYKIKKMVCFINNYGMDFNSTIDIIIKDLREISEIVDDLKKYPDVPPLQIELVKSKCRSAVEIISLLKTFRPGTGSEPAIEPVSAGGREPATSLFEIPEEVPVAVSAVTSGKPAPKADNRENEDIASAFRSKPRSELSQAIGLNDKFLFIRGIFGGNAAAYEEAISKLSKAENLPDAKAIIMSYTGEAEETEEVSQLLEIVRQKLPSNG